MEQRPRLRKTAIPAGLVFLVAAGFMFINQQAMGGLITDRVMYGIGGALVILAVLLFVGRRTVWFVVLFGLMAVFSAIGLCAWILVKVQELILLFPVIYGVRLYSFVAMLIVCARRLNGPRSGAWVLAVCPQAGLIAYLVYFSINHSAIAVYFLYTEPLLFLGLLLTCIAFRYAPVKSMSSEPERPSGFSYQTESREQGATKPAESTSTAKKVEPPHEDAAEPQIKAAEFELLDE